MNHFSARRYTPAKPRSVARIFATGVALLAMFTLGCQRAATEPQGVAGQSPPILPSEAAVPAEPTAPVVPTASAEPAAPEVAAAQSALPASERDALATAVNSANPATLPAAGATTALSNPSTTALSNVANSVNAAAALTTVKPVTAEPAKEGASPSTPNEPPQLPENAVQRLLVLTPHGPLVLDLAIFIDGSPHMDALTKLAETMRGEADADHDGKVAWTELFENPVFRYGLYGNAPTGAALMQKDSVELYDANRNALVEPNEIIRFIASANNRIGQSFTLQSESFFAGVSDIDDPLWNALDVDKSGELELEEVNGAVERLRGFDSDGDEMLSLVDFSKRTFAFTGGNISERPPRMNTSGTRAVLALREFGKRREILAASLADAYPSYDGLSPADVFPLDPELFTQLDADGDMKISVEETESLHQAAPHCVVRLDFNPAAKLEKQPTSSEHEPLGNQERASDAATAPIGEPTLKLLYLSPRIADAIRAQVEKNAFFALRLRDFEMEIFVNDQAVGIDYSAQAAARVAALDVNKDGYLTPEEAKRELAPDLQPFEAMDANQDGMVFPVELAAYLSRRDAYAFTQTQVRAGGRQGLLFNQLDVDRNGELSARELADTANKLRALDRTNDGRIAQQDTASGFSIAVARSSRGDDAFVRQADAPAIRTDAPDWFQGMDLNQDGDISKREFIGAAEDFGRLDSSGDGFLTVEEAIDH